MIIVELCGMYGAGKTTTHKQMVQGQQHDIRACYRLPRYRNIHRLAINTFRIISTLFLAGWDRDSLRDLRLLAYVYALAQDLYCSKHRMKGSLVWEEGPVRILSILWLQVKRYPNRVLVERELSRGLRQLAKVLDGVIWLDAPETILAERVRARPQRHRLKSVGLDEAIEFYREYRAAYQDILAILRQCEVPILHLSTDQHDPEQITRIAWEFITSLEGTLRNTAQGNR